MAPMKLARVAMVAMASAFQTPGRLPRASRAGALSAATITVPEEAPVAAAAPSLSVVSAPDSAAAAEEAPLSLESFVRADGQLDAIGLAAWAKYERKPLARPLGVAYFAAMFALIGCQGAPVFLRLLTLQYANYSFFEYVFHRWCMHAKHGTLADRVFARWNRLHVQHHLDTHDDMTMEDDYNWKGIRFNYLTTKLSMAISCLFSVTAVAAFDLRLPFWPTPIAAALVSLYHGVLWNRLHTDSHDLEATLTWTDGLPYFKGVPCGNRYARWLLTNHIGHHNIRGTGNYNIVFPGPDHLAGTFYRLVQ